jgi:hypothetical protein
MAELGATSDPRALIPGLPEVIEADATALAGHGRRAEQVGQGLKGVDVRNWAGDAGRRFADTWAKEPPRWLTMADSIGATTTAMTSYAGTLRWAQNQAGGAIQLWEQGNQATTRAFAEYQTAAADAAARNVPIGPFTDPGEGYREQARELLAGARGQLRDAGDQAARAISGDAVGTPGAGARVGGSLNRLVDGVTDGWSAQGRFDGKRPNSGITPTVAQSGKLADLKAYAQLGSGTWSGYVRDGQLTLSGKGGFDIGAQANGFASLTDKGLAAKVEVSTAARVSAEGHADIGQVGVYGRATGMAGADANAGVRVGKDAVLASAGAFAGIRGKVAGGADSGGLAVGATAEGWLGVGAEAKIGWERSADGKFEFKPHVGAALGIGGSVGFEVTVDPTAVEHTARDAADAIGAEAHAVSSQVGEVADYVAHDVAEVRDSVHHAAGSIGDALNPFD